MGRCLPWTADSSGAVLEAPRRVGRLRRLNHLGIGVLGVAAAWCCIGVFGAVPMAIWAWFTRPAPLPCGARWRVPLADVKRIRLGPWRTRIALRRGPALEVFRDEMDGADLARLRRMLRSRSG